MRFRRFIFLMVFVSLGRVGWSQNADDVSGDSLQTISFSGSIDTYYHRAFNTKQDAPRTSFSNLPGFSLGMINLVLEYSGSKAGFVADVVIGPRGADAIFNAPRYRNAAGGASSQMINQMFVYYNLNERLRISAGQFNTFVGYETITPVKNINYSTSYLFSFGPFNHTGVWADLKLGDHCAAKLAVMNPTDYTEFNPFNSYTVGGQLSITKRTSMLNFNVTYGDPDGHLKAADSIGSVSAGNAFQADVAGQLNVSEKYTVGLSSSMRSIHAGQRKTTASDQTVIESCGYYGIALYQTFSIGPSAKIGVRTEHFTEINGGVGAIGSYSSSGRASVFACTVSGNFTQSNLRFIPEIRLDKTSGKSFTALATGSPMTHMVSLNLAVVYQIPVISRKIK